RSRMKKRKHTLNTQLSKSHSRPDPERRTASDVQSNEPLYENMKNNSRPHDERHTFCNLEMTEPVYANTT
ncbi:hypothetical protein QQF64_000252, partial [Cirrhinus molitorella]